MFEKKLQNLCLISIYFFFFYKDLVCSFFIEQQHLMPNNKYIINICIIKIWKRYVIIKSTSKM